MNELDENDIDVCCTTYKYAVRLPAATAVFHYKEFLRAFLPCHKEIIAQIGWKERGKLLQK